MRITLELEPEDIARFDAALARARHSTASADEVDVIDAAKYALDHLDMTTAPGYVRKRLVEVQRLIVMLEDEAWALIGAERDDVLETLAYFSDPDDLIPDHIEVIGLLDDAIMLELLLRRLRRVRKAYAEFCAFREAQTATDRAERARDLAACRAQLQTRMRKRSGGRAARAATAPRAAHGG